MRRIETYVGQQVYEWSFSAQAQYTMTAIAKLCSALLGTSVTANGLACTPTSPAGMTVQIGAGELYQLESLEATACGTLPQDTTHQILKQGIQLGAYTTSAFAAPATSGQSVNYLIQAQYQDSDISLDPTSGASPVVLQFYDADNPASPWSGPNNGGATSNTFRDGVIAYQIKAGVAATTGTQVTPTPDSGWTGLWVVTLAFGQSSITSTSIAQYTGAPILPSSILSSLLTSNLTYGIDNGSANTIQATFPIPVATLTDGMDVCVKIKAANNGATTFTPNPGVIAPSPVVGGAHAALQGGELVASGRANLTWRQDISSWVLAFCTGGAEQVAPATASQHAVQFGQVAGVVGSVRNLKCVLAAAGTSLTFTADEVVVESALGGLRYCLASLNATLNGGTTGLGGLDTGALAANSFYAIYAAIKNDGTKGIFAQLEPVGGAPSIYGGANPPANVIATALISVWKTNGSSQFQQGYQRDRKVLFPQINGISSTTAQASFTSLSIAGIVPKCAVRAMGWIGYATPATGTNAIAVAGDSTGSGQRETTSNGSSGLSASFELEILTAQTLYYTATASGGSFTTIYIVISGYEI